jgi:hypothetical protein
MPVILATQEAEIRRIMVQSQPGQTVCETLPQKNPSQKGLVEWLKVYALSSNPSTANKKKKKKRREGGRKNIFCLFSWDTPLWTQSY